MASKEKEWWEPNLCNKQHFERLRSDYPEHANKNDDELHDYFDDRKKYSVTWDHVGDAYDEYEKLADAYVKLKAQLAKP